MAGQNESTETSLISMPFFTEIGSETKFFSFGGLQESPFYAIISKIFWYRHSAQGRKYHGIIIPWYFMNAIFEDEGSISSVN